MTILNLTTERTVELHRVLTALSSAHAHGHLTVRGEYIAMSLEMSSADVGALLSSAAIEAWAYLQLDGVSWRLMDGVVTQVAMIPDCDICRMIEGTSIPAIADARTDGGRWGYVCAEHFVTESCTLGLGRGQLLRVDEV
jgi:hypothetical protein